jgi:hypothetical protein
MDKWMLPGPLVPVFWGTFQKKTVETMQNISVNEPLRVSQEAVEAYEKRTGFFGIGKKMVEHGRWKIVGKEEASCQHR